MSALADVEILAPADEEVLTRQALDLVARLHRELNPRRRELLERRYERQVELDAGALPGFLSQTKDVRDAEWRVAEAVARGLSNKEIAAELNLSLRTIEGHISRILDKKNLNNRVELALHIAARGRQSE